MTKTLHGKAHGKMIELDEDLGIADGQDIEVQVTLIAAPTEDKPPMSEGLAKIYAMREELVLTSQEFDRKVRE